MSSNKRSGTLTPEQRRLLLDLAKDSISYGLTHGRPPTPALHGMPQAFAEPRATFVTLHKDSALRGCIGTLEPVRPLVLDIVHNAFAAAFRDPRFPPVTAPELSQLVVHISLLTPAEPIAFSSERELLEQLVPFADGLILEEGFRRGTFLPAVWESLPEPDLFLEHLKMKAGLPRNYWSDTLKVSRYRTEIIE